MTIPLRPLPLAGSERVTPDATTQRVNGGRASGIYANHGKRVLDIVIVLLALPFVLPLMAVIAVALRREGGGAFFVQKRIGRGGRVFSLIKFRTMVPDAEARLQAFLDADPALRDEWDATQKLKSDPRITPLGNILRRTSMDELPQLINVLRGDMSLIGPRPMMLGQLELYGPHIASYVALRPGISGAWQVSERNDAFFVRRAEIDAEYARDVSLRRDLGILVDTLRVVWRATGY